MESLNISINKKELIVDVALTEEEQEKGLQGVKELKDNEGLLFVFPEPQQVSFWMKDTDIPLDIIFINEDLEVISVAKGEPNTEDAHVENDVAFVLEVNQNSGIKAGDELDFAPDKKVDSRKMLVLNSEGKSQMELDGGERIFSRPHTKILIRFAKKAYSSEKDSDFKNLGKRLFKFLQTQEDTEPEYVKSKN